MVCRGFSSETFAYDAAEAWAAEPHRTPLVAYVGDYDPAGLEIEANLKSKLATFYAKARGFHFVEIPWTRVGTTIEQILDLDLVATGTEPKKEYGFPLAWEAEALPASFLREELEAEITSYVDEDALEPIRAAEKSEREILTKIAETARGTA